MGVFKTSAPIPPGPKSKFNAGREAEIVKALAEAQILVTRLIQTLAPFQPKEITDANGRKLIVLAQDLGKGRAVESGFHPFQLVNASEGTTLKIRVIYGIVAGEPPTGMSDGDDPPYILTVTGDGVIYLIVTIDPETGIITSRTIGIGEEVPDDNDTTYHQEIGSFTVDEGEIKISQAVSGSLSFIPCRDWFSDPVSYTPVWGRI